MAKHFNITGASSAAAELTRELVAVRDNVNVSSISLVNVHATTKCSVDLYIEKKLTGKFYLLKGVSLPTGVTLSHDIKRIYNKDFGLYIKLTKSASEIPSVDVILS
jgi:hypothetical protein|tara:strand:+ start:109 stop:426 length:318 start_codon:yes stop_codon:yes gene_type:complete